MALTLASTWPLNIHAKTFSEPSGWKSLICELKGQGWVRVRMTSPIENLLKHKKPCPERQRSKFQVDTSSVIYINRTETVSVCEQCAVSMNHRLESQPYVFAVVWGSRLLKITTPPLFSLSVIPLSLSLLRSSVFPNTRAPCQQGTRLYKGVTKD